LVQIGRLLIERKEVKFSVEEGELYYRLFSPFGVDPKLFSKLVKHARWKTYEKGDVIVSNSMPLKRVHLLVHGSATCSSGVENKKLYTYSATDKGCIIGATAVVDPTILGRSYPNQIVADERVRALSFNTNELRKFLKENESTAEAALLHLMYIDLLGALRRDRRLGETLQKLTVLLEEQCSSNGQIDPQGRRAVREFIEEHKITDMQFKSILQSLGWTTKEWKDGAKHTNQLTRLRNRLSNRFLPAHNILLCGQYHVKS
jgi:CRP-like cAMP-binding protein